MKTETFSYLPPLTPEQVRKQIHYLLNNGWIAGIEFAKPGEISNTYWSWWKLPMFNAHTPEEIWTEIEACRTAHPDCYIRLTGYDRSRQAQVMSFVVYQPEKSS